MGRHHCRCLGFAQRLRDMSTEGSLSHLLGHGASVFRFHSKGRTNVVAIYDKKGYNLDPYRNPCSVTGIGTLFLILINLLIHKNDGMNTNLWTKFTNKQFDQKWSLHHVEKKDRQNKDRTKNRDKVPLFEIQ